jgi:hypothetical protein
MVDDTQRAFDDAVRDHYEGLRRQQPEEIGPNDLDAFDAFDGRCIDETAQLFGITSQVAADIIYERNPEEVFNTLDTPLDQWPEEGLRDVIAHCEHYIGQFDPNHYVFDPESYAVRQQNERIATAGKCWDALIRRGVATEADKPNYT